MSATAEALLLIFAVMDVALKLYSYNPPQHPSW